jgi:Flp pilus assembly protein TadG
MNRTETGAVTVFVTIFTVALLAMAGLVADGSRILAARRDAANIAEAAARAGAEALDLQDLRSAEQIRLDPTAAIARADAYLAAAGYHGTVHAEPDAVTVTVTVRRTTLLLGAVGMHTFTVTESGTAAPIRGIETAVP